MPRTKPSITTEQLSTYLTDHTDFDPVSIKPITEGEISRAFCVRTNANDEYIVRVAAKDNYFQKDKYAYEHLSSPHIPIPEIVHTGVLDENSYIAISHKLPGITMNCLPQKDQNQLSQELFTLLEHIASVPIDTTTEFGYWDTSGNAPDSSWKEHVLGIRGYIEETATKFDIDFFEKNRCDELYALLEQQVSFCPEIRHLIHGDFGHDNILANDGKITAVLDWAESRYGDPLWDIAWLDYYSEILFVELAREQYQPSGFDFTNYDERIAAYRLYFGIGALCFFTQTNQPKKYQDAKKRIEQTLNTYSLSL